MIAPGICLTSTRRRSSRCADSAAYQAEIFNWCEASGKQFAIGADHDTAVKAAIAAIPAHAWKAFRDGEIAETVHCMNKTKKAFRLIVMRRAPRRSSSPWAYCGRSPA